MSVLNTLKLWQIAVLVAVLVGGIGGAYMIFAFPTTSSQASLSEDEQLVPVQFGNLVNQVSTSGSLVFPIKETLSFRGQSTIGDVFVTEGEEVVEGQALVTLDPVTIASLVEVVASARIDQRDAQEVLTIALDHASATGEAENDMEAASITLSNASGDLLVATTDWDAKLADAEEVLTTAEGAYQEVFDRWLGASINDAESSISPADLFNQWALDLDNLFTQDSDSFELDLGWFSIGPPSDSPETVWSEPVIYAWLNFYPGTIVGTCENGEHPVEGTCVQKAFDDAWSDLETAASGLEVTQIQAAKAISNAESVVEQAQQRLGDAEEALANVLMGPDSLLADLRQAEPDSANLALEDALGRLEDSTLKAPMNGVISQINVEPGQTVQGTLTAIEIVDTSVVELEGLVDEIDVLFVSLGASAQVTMDALAGEVLSGTVSSISSSAQTDQGIVSFPIQIRVELPAGVELREGLSANASIVIREEANVLLVPIQAIFGTFQQPLLRVMTNGTIEERPVTLGNSDDFWVVAVDGIAEGEQVVMEVTQTSTNQFTFGGFGGLGGFGGGGRPAGGFGGGGQGGGGQGDDH